jgi:hypothetical protein
MKSLMKEVIDQTPPVVAQAEPRLPRPFPETIADRILNGTVDAAKLLAEQMIKGH